MILNAIHGDLTQQQRDKVMGLFRDKSIQLLIATDVAARGIDVQGLPMSSIMNCLMMWKYIPTAAVVQAGRVKAVSLFPS